MQCKEVELVLEEQGFAPIPEAARAHLADCLSCRNLVADLTEIVATAHLLPVEVDPPQHIWNSIQSQLIAEGVIKTPAAQVERVSWWESISHAFRARAFATAAVGL